MGGKYKFAQAKDEFLKVRVSSREHEMFKELAKEKGAPLSKIVRDILMKEYMEWLKNSDF